MIVSTSNRHPSELYKHGLQRDLFTPFIRYVLTEFIVHDIDSKVDYRTSTFSSSKFKCYYEPVSDASYKDFYRTFTSLSEHPAVVFSETLLVLGRSLEAKAVVKTPSGDKVALFDFKELCGRALGPADFIHLAETFRGVCISNVPIMTLSERSEVKRRIYRVFASFL